MRKTIAVVILAVAILTACTKEQAQGELDAVKRAKDVARKANAHSIPGGTGDDEFGITECDDYMKKMSACITDKVPADDQPALRFEMESQKRKWADMSRDPAGKDSLPAECRSAAAVAMQSTGKYGCEW